MAKVLTEIKIMKTIERSRFEMSGSELIVCLLVASLKPFGKTQWDKTSIRKKSTTHTTPSDGRLYL